MPWKLPRAPPLCQAAAPSAGGARLAQSPSPPAVGPRRARRGASGRGWDLLARPPHGLPLAAGDRPSNWHHHA